MGISFQLEQANMVYSFTEKSTTGSGMLCYQTAAKGLPALQGLLTVTQEHWAANTGAVTSQTCRERDAKYGGATQAKAVLRAAGLAWQATPGNLLGVSPSGTKVPKRGVRHVVRVTIPTRCTDRKTKMLLVMSVVEQTMRKHVINRDGIIWEDYQTETLNCS